MGMAPVDLETETQKKGLEEGIRALKAIMGKEVVVKELEEQLKNLQKKKPVHSPEKDCMSVAKSLTDAMEKAGRHTAQAERRLEKVMSVQSDLEKKHVAHAKKLKEEYDMHVQVAQSSYEKEKLRIDEEVEQEKLNLEKTKKEAEASVTQSRLAMGNVAAVTAGSQQKMETGQQSAGAVAAPGAVLVSTAPGFILHGNDVSTEEMQQHLLTDPALTGMTPDMAAACAASQMRLCQARSTAVAAFQVDAGQPLEGNAEVHKSTAPRQEAEDDPMTSDDEENEIRLANKKGDETVEKARISRSAKAAKKAKTGKSAGASNAAGPVVKTTIGKQSS